MAKYRGKHEGKTRGKYVEVRFTHVFDNNTEWLNGCRDIDARIAEMGHFVSGSENLRNKYNTSVHDVNPFNKYIGVIHLAGATVGIEGISYIKKPENDTPQHRVDMKIVSNDSIDDVIEKIKSRMRYSLERKD